MLTLTVNNIGSSAGVSMYAPALLQPIPARPPPKHQLTVLGAAAVAQKVDKLAQTGAKQLDAYGDKHPEMFDKKPQVRDLTAATPVSWMPA